MSLEDSFCFFSAGKILRELRTKIELETITEGVVLGYFSSIRI